MKKDVTNQSYSHALSLALFTATILCQFEARAANATDDPAENKVTPTKSGIDLRISRAVDMHFLTRVLSGDTERDTPTGLRPQLLLPKS